MLTSLERRLRLSKWISGSSKL